MTIGRPPRLLAKELLGAVDAVRTPRPSAPGCHRRRQPANPGRGAGPVRIIHGPGDFDRFQPDEVLVARATAPAWTPLFARAVHCSTGALAGDYRRLGCYMADSKSSEGWRTHSDRSATTGNQEGAQFAVS